MTASYVNWSACLHEIRADQIRLRPVDAHGALFLYLTDGVSIRIQVTPTMYEDADNHAADLERDLAGLRRLAEAAAQAADQIESRNSDGAQS